MQRSRGHIDALTNENETDTRAGSTPRDNQDIFGVYAVTRLPNRSVPTIRTHCSNDPDVASGCLELTYWADV